MTEVVKQVGSGCFVGNAEADESTKGYFLGSFMEQVGKPELDFGMCEAAVLDLPETDDSKPHYHEIMTEVTYVIEGELSLRIWDVDGKRGVKLTKGQYLLVEPGAVIQNPKNEKGTKIFVVKFPSISGDKKYIEPSEI